jgi:putative oxygen-independent coproporphyrinogen III oxidase
MSEKAGLYIHIPFCASRCIYCGFYSTTSLSLRERYVNALCKEMELLLYKPKIGTIYLGGGTPSQLSHQCLEKLFIHIYNVYDVNSNAEVTMECNPDDIVEGMFKDLPVNRVSMGAQTFSGDRLHFLHRRHSAAEVDKAVDILRQDGIANISLDLMFGFPYETMKDWKSDIRHALALHPEHLSAYGLMYEEGTPLYRMLEQGQVKEIDEELSLSMYSELIDTLTASGYEHYEISNFARLDNHAVSPWRSKHNSSYWHDVPYIGLGAGAHSYYQRTRHWNPDNLIRYMESIEKGVLPYEEEQIDDDTHYDDIVTTALRTREGINLSLLDEKHRSYLLKNAEDYLKRGLMALDNNHLHLTREGINISNRIMSDLMDV